MAYYLKEPAKVIIDPNTIDKRFANQNILGERNAYGEVDCSSYSSNIAMVGYNYNTLILTISFQNGGTYEYHNVPRIIFEEIRKRDQINKLTNSNSASIGSYLYEMGVTAKGTKAKFKYRRIS